MDKAFASLLENMVSRWTLTLRKLGDSFAQATQFSRFINNAKVTPQAILDEYWQTSTLGFQGRHLLVISDTSTLTFRQFAKREDLGLIDDQSDKMGFNIHPAVVMDAQTKSCYGVAGICVLRKKRLYTKAEKEERASRQSKRNSTPFDKKERYKWFSACEQVVARCPNAASYTLVGDREADIYALMSMVVERGWHFVYRSKHNRKGRKPDCRFSSPNWGLGGRKATIWFAPIES